MGVKVSVVVPVFNPGPHIDPLIRSLQQQTMPASGFETIFVDDGSTDATPGKLDRLAEASSNVTVVHIPNSGWPGRPRNIGIDTAVGEFIQFVDHDDELGAEALERLYAYALENGSDVVIGKEVRKGGPWHVAPTFDRNRPRATLADDPILGILTPHKMFRREFLHQHHIRFFEGPRRMEDHPFVLEAFFCAGVISVLSDYPVYYWRRRPDRGNAGARAYEWADYYVYMRDTLDVVERYTEPGTFRDWLLSFWYDSKGLNVLARATPHRTREESRTHFDALRELTQERFAPSVDAQLMGVSKARSQLLRAGDFEGMLALGTFESGIGIHQELTEMVAAEGKLRVRVLTGLCDSNGSALMFQVEDGRTWWRPPSDLGDAVSPDVLDFTEVYARKRIELALRNRQTHEVHLLQRRAEPLAQVEPGVVPFTFDAVFEIDPESAAGGRPLQQAVYDLFVRVTCSPWRRQAPLESLPGQGVRAPMTDEVRTLRSVVPFTTSSGRVALDVDHQTLARRTQETDMSDDTNPPAGTATTSPGGPAVALETISSYARRTGDQVRLVMHLPGVTATGRDEVRVRLKRGKASVVADATVTELTPGVRVVAAFPDGRLTPGTWGIAVSVGAQERFQRVRARLLLSTTRPIALLTGPGPGRPAPGRLATTSPRPATAGPARRSPAKARSTRPLWVRRAGRRADRALGVLPPAQAARARRLLRAAARRLPG